MCCLQRKVCLRAKHMSRLEYEQRLSRLCYNTRQCSSYSYNAGDFPQQLWRRQRHRCGSHAVARVPLAVQGTGELDECPGTCTQRASCSSPRHCLCSAKHGQPHSSLLGSNKVRHACSFSMLFCTQVCMPWDMFSVCPLNKPLFFLAGKAIVKPAWMQPGTTCLACQHNAHHTGVCAPADVDCWLTSCLGTCCGLHFSA